MSPVEILKNCIAEKQAELVQLQMALKILEPVTQSRDSVIQMPAEPSVAPTQVPLPADVPAKTAEPAPIRKQEVYTGPRCGACQNKMYQSYRTMPSGAMVSLWKCNDSACGNEVYQ